MINLECGFAAMEQRLAAILPKAVPLLDLHKMTAAAMYHTAYSDVTPAQRKKAKVWNFRFLYSATGWQPPSRQHFITMFSASELKQIQIDTAWDGSVDLYDHVMNKLTGKSK